jgi:hypothetical protein
MGLSDSGEEPEFSGSIKWGKFLDYLTYFLKKDLFTMELICYADN